MSIFQWSVFSGQCVLAGAVVSVPVVAGQCVSSDKLREFGEGGGAVKRDVNGGRQQPSFVARGEKSIETVCSNLECCMKRTEISIKVC